MVKGVVAVGRWSLPLLLASTVFLAGAGGVRAAETVRMLIIPEKETVISSQMGGRILELNTRPGRSFEKGDLLVRFDCKEQDARLKAAEAELSATEITLKAKKELQALSSAGEMEVQLAAAANEKTKAQLELQRAYVDACIIRAPFAGTTARLDARQFQTVNQGQPILEIVGREPLLARIIAPSRWLSWLKVGRPFRVSVDETRTSHDAVVTAINGKVDPVSQTVEIEGTIAARGASLLPGMSGTATFGKDR